MLLFTRRDDAAQTHTHATCQREREAVADSDVTQINKEDVLFLPFLILELELELD